MTMIPNRITWIVDLTKGEEELFGARDLKRISSSRYLERVKYEILPADQVMKKFLPSYEKFIMSRDDYRLNKQDAIQKIRKISTNNEYQLMWFTDIPTGMDYGGVVIHAMDNQLRLAYRCYDHSLARSFGLLKIDYYAEKSLHNYIRSIGYLSMSLGRDSHPVNQVGLSTYKLRIGARPTQSVMFEDVEVSNEIMYKLSLDTGMSGYYSDSVDGTYVKFHLFGERDNDLVQSFVKVAQRANIQVVFEEF